MSRVDVVILNWNGRRFLQPCLDSLFSQAYRDFQVWLVDNGSTDGSPAFMREHYPGVHLLCNDHNRGFAAANNQAIRVSGAEFVATLNNDTVVDIDWLASLVDVLDKYPQAGAAASKMLFADRPAMVNSAGIAVDRAGIAWDRCGGQDDNSFDNQPQPIFGACAGAALYRRAMLDDIGLFDEAYFAYLEDVDLAWRAQWAGWQTIYVPTARVYHHHSATGGEGSPFKNRLLGRNKLRLIARNYPVPHVWLYLLPIMAYDIGSVTYALLSRKETSPLAGRLVGICQLPAAWRSRRNLVRRISAFAMMRQLAPLDTPWHVLVRYRHLRLTTTSD
ncbi:MAG: glycosyltransferase family 2 protein [Chloroflexi bacterium]|nr:glycosyltransferase family 2 protein [Chloroflexota bacterium]